MTEANREQHLWELDHTSGRYEVVVSRNPGEIEITDPNQLLVILGEAPNENSHYFVSIDKGRILLRTSVPFGRRAFPRQNSHTIIQPQTEPYKLILSLLPVQNVDDMEIRKVGADIRQELGGESSDAES